MRLRFGFLFQMAALFDSLTVFDNVAFGLREHHLCDEDEDPDDRAPSGSRRSACPPSVGTEEAGRALRRAAEARRAGAGPGPRPGGDALRRADHRARPDHERRDQRADPADPQPAPDDGRGRDPRHEDGHQGRRPRGHALSAWPAAARTSRRSSTTARPRRWTGSPTPASASSCVARPASD